MAKTIETDKRWPDWAVRFANKIAADVDQITSFAEATVANGDVYLARRGSSQWVDASGRSIYITNPWTGQPEVANPMQSQVWNARRFYREVYVADKRRGVCWSSRPASVGRLDMLAAKLMPKRFAHLGPIARGASPVPWKHTIILGTKLNGRFALTFRFWHTDAASAAGTTGANYGQAIGDTFGPA